MRTCVSALPLPSFCCLGNIQLGLCQARWAKLCWRYTIFLAQRICNFLSMAYCALFMRSYWWECFLRSKVSPLFSLHSAKRKNQGREKQFLSKSHRKKCTSFGTLKNSLFMVINFCLISLTPLTHGPWPLVCLCNAYPQISVDYWAEGKCTFSQLWGHDKNLQDVTVINA